MTRRQSPGGCIDTEGGSAIIMILIALVTLTRRPR
jgi:hypothetical protein